MPAGDLRHRVAIESLVQAEGTSPAMTPTYTVVDTVWASLRTPRGVAKLEGEAVDVHPTHLFRIRYRSDVDRAKFLRWNGTRFNILEVTNERGRKVWLDLQCEEREDL